MFQALISDNGTDVAEIERRAEEALGLIADENGAVATLQREAGRTVVATVLPSVFVELELDWQEQAVFVLVGEPFDGQRPAGYYVDPQGRKARWHLSAALDRSSDPAIRGMAERLREVTQRSGIDAMVTQVDTSAEVIREVLPHLPALVRQHRA
ncbi:MULTISPECIES: hypothetical protein [unclassified Micromonospora]|uniref:hypothetical protein n=1 Tax=unclassified Micromonospora TaxID=2617518 RepID=UPI002FF403EE